MPPKNVAPWLAALLLFPASRSLPARAADGGEARRVVVAQSARTSSFWTVAAAAPALQVAPSQPAIPPLEAGPISPTAEALFVIDGQFMTAAQAGASVPDPAQFRAMVNSLSGHSDSGALDDAPIRAILEQDERETKEAAKKASVKAGPVDLSRPYKGPYLSPIKAGVVTGRFGEWRGDHSHSGLDLAAPSGTPIFSSAPGKVLFAGWSGGYGRLLIVRHDNSTTSYYGHCSAFKVKKGKVVRAGDRIGSVGSTGFSTGPHVHFEIRLKGDPINPCRRLKRC